MNGSVLATLAKIWLRERSKTSSFTLSAIWRTAFEEPTVAVIQSRLLARKGSLPACRTAARLINVPVWATRTVTEQLAVSFVRSVGNVQVSNDPELLRLPCEAPATNDVTVSENPWVTTSDAAAEGPRLVMVMFSTSGTPAATVFVLAVRFTDRSVALLVGASALRRMKSWLPEVRNARPLLPHRN